MWTVQAIKNVHIQKPPGSSKMSLYGSSVSPPWYDTGVTNCAQAQQNRWTERLWPKRSSELLLDMLKNTESNGGFKGLDRDSVVFEHVQVSKMHHQTPELMVTATKHEPLLHWDDHTDKEQKRRLHRRRFPRRNSRTYSPSISKFSTEQRQIHILQWGWSAFPFVFSAKINTTKCI